MSTNFFNYENSHISRVFEKVKPAEHGKEVLDELAP
jgi:hypothetical protein